MENKCFLFATTNNGKLKEVKAIFEKDKIEVIGLKDVENLLEGIAEPVEDGKTFAENALIKAKYYANILKVSCLADDSGLEVEALNGEPGVFSARYASLETFESFHDDEANIRKLLTKLENVANRLANFRCSMVYYDYFQQRAFQTEGILKGKIIDQKKGSLGFGYDPIFIPDGYEITLSQMPNEEKNKISHRFKALTKMIEKLKSESFL